MSGPGPTRTTPSSTSTRPTCTSVTSARCGPACPPGGTPEGTPPPTSRLALMRAWILDESPGHYRFGDIDPPEPGPEDVRVRVVASALNHMDLWLTKGMPKPPVPHVPGCDGAGVVDAVGSE